MILTIGPPPDLRFSETATQTCRREDAEFELHQLKSTLAERAHQLSHAETKVSLLQQELKVTKDTQQALVQCPTSSAKSKGLFQPARRADYHQSCGEPVREL